MVRVSRTSDAAGAVHDVEALALEVDVSGDVLAVDFVGAEVDALFDEVGAGVDQLADALARGVVLVVGVASAAEVGALPSGRRGRRRWPRGGASR
jgi:hypothetical protein